MVVGLFFGIDAMRANLLLLYIFWGHKKKKASCLCNDIASITSEPFNLIRSKWEVIRADYNPNLNGAMMSPRH